MTTIPVEPAPDRNFTDADLDVLADKLVERTPPAMAAEPISAPAASAPDPGPDPSDPPTAWEAPEAVAPEAEAEATVADTPPAEAAAPEPAPEAPSGAVTSAVGDLLSRLNLGAVQHQVDTVVAWLREHDLLA